MKTIIIALLLSGTAHAEFLTKGKCYKMIMIGYNIHQKLDKTHFVMTAPLGSPIQEYAIMESKSIVPMRGQKANFDAEYVGTTMRELSSGFKTKADVWKDCK